MAEAEVEAWGVSTRWVEQFDRDNEWMADLDWSRHRHLAGDYVSEMLMFSGVAKVFADHLCAPSYPNVHDFIADAGNSPSGGMVDADQAFAPDGTPIHSVHARLSDTVRRHADEHGVGIARPDVITKQEWARLIEKVGDYWAAGNGARRAVTRLAPIIAGLAARGEIKCYARPLGGGPLNPIVGPDWWDLDPDIAVRRLAACGLNIARPFDAEAPVDHLVFVARAELPNAAVNAARQHYVPTAALEYGEHILKRRADFYSVQVEEVAAFLIALMASGDCETWTNTQFSDAVQKEFGQRGLGRCYERAKAIAISDPKREKFGKRRPS